MMAGGGKTNASTGGTGGSTTFSWNGGSVPKTFDQKNFGTTIASDLSKWYQTAPQTNPIADYTPYSTQTSGLINQGLGQASNVANNTVLQGMASGSQLGQGNPYLQDMLRQANENAYKTVGGAFTNSGRFGGGSFVDTLGKTINDSNSAALFGQYNQDIQNMYGAQNALNNATATGLGYSNLLDSKAKELNASNQKQWQLTNDAPLNRISQTFGLLNGGVNNNTNQPTSFWDILGTGLNVAGSILPFL